jgi:hypothetical protein
VVVAAEGLTTFVVGYDDLAEARGDYEDLATVRHESRVGDYEAALVRQTGSGHELVVTTVDPRARWTVRQWAWGV